MLKFSTISIILVFLAISIYFFILGRISQNQPTRLMEAEALAQCPDKPNCVCSEHEQDVEHYIAPLEMADFSVFEDMNPIKKIIVEMGGEIVYEQTDYLSAIFKSGIFGFVDDFEIRIDRHDQQLHIRSASRVGRSDFGANQKRVVDFKRRLNDKMNNS